MSVRALAIARGAAVISGTAAMIVVGTYAATFQTNTVAAQDINLNTTNDLLRIYDFNSATFSGNTTNPGGAVQINNISLVPGTESEHKPFYLKNLSSNEFALTAHTNTPVLSGIADTSKVYVNFYDKNDVLVSTRTLADLATDQPTGLTLPADAQGDSSSVVDGDYFVSFKMDVAAMSGSSASVHSMDLIFTGNVVTP